MAGGSIPGHAVGPKQQKSLRYIGFLVILFCLGSACSEDSPIDERQANVDLAKQFFQDVDASGGSLEFVDKWVTDDFQSRLNSRQAMDKEGYKQFMGAALSGFAEMRHEIQYTLAKDDRVALGITLHLTHTGEFLGVPATGKTAAVEEIVVIRFRDGKIAEEWGVFDLAGLMQQITPANTTD